MDLLQLLLGGIIGAISIPLLILIFRFFTLEVEDESVLVVTNFGKMKQIFKTPGLHFFPKKMLPWIKLYEISLKRDYRHYEKIHVNDCRGTTLIIDLWIEFKITEPEKALFQVENWEKSLQSLLTSSGASILGSFEFYQILTNRTELGLILKKDLEAETARWGIQIELIFISKLSLLPDVSQQLFDAVAARLEKAKGDIQEAGRLEVEYLEAITASQVAALEAEAKGQYSLAIGRAYSQLSIYPGLLDAYIELHKLSLVKPHRTISFQGFKEHGITSTDAAMFMPSHLEGSHPL